MADLANDLEELLEMNKRLREELGISNKFPPLPLKVESGWLERQNEVLLYQLEITKKNKAMLETEAGRKEILYRLQVLESIPLPVWSSDLNSSIRHWNAGAENIYGHTAKQALGKNFIDLIVSEPEKAQAKEDLSSIIQGQEGLEHFNLCEDWSKNQRRKIYLVTCCFPVFDNTTGLMVQAEVSFDLSTLDVLEKELKELHTKYFEDQQTRREFVKIHVSKMLSELDRRYQVRRDRIENAINVNEEAISNPQSSGKTINFHKEQLRRCEIQLSKLDEWDASMKKNIAEAETEERLKRSTSSNKGKT